MTHDSALRSAIVAVCLLCSVAAPSRAQTAPGACEWRGLVVASGKPLPGVSLTTDGPGGALQTSSDERGAWRVTLPAGPHRLTLALQGFRPVVLERTVATDSCPEAAVVSLTVAPASAGDPLSAPVTWTPPLTPAPTLPAAASPTVVRGRSATVDHTVSRAPAIPAQRLYSATSSYTVAASALDSAPYQLRRDTAQPKPDYFRHSADFTVGGPLRVPGGRVSRTNVTLSYSGIRGNNLFDQYATVPTAAMRAGDLSGLGIPVRDPLTGSAFPGAVIPRERLAPTATALLNAYPLPNGDGLSRNFHRTSTNRSTQDTFNLRLTQPLVGTAIQTGRAARGGPRGGGQAVALSAQLNVQIDYRKNVNDRLNALPAIAGVGENHSLRIPISVNITRRGSQHAVSATVTSTRNDTVNRYAGVENVGAGLGIAGASTEPFTWGLPTLGFASVTGLSDLTPSSRHDTRITGGYSWSTGLRAHRLRLGGEIGVSRTTGRTDQNARGTFVFTGLYSGSDVGDFLLGLPQQASVQFGPGVVRLSNRTASLFVQDDWRRWSRVTVNAGLRYELVTPFRDAAARLVNLDPAPGYSAVAPVVSGGTGPYSGAFPTALVRTDSNNLAPRLGIAWRLARRTTARLGYGVSFNTGAYSSIARQLASQPPFAITSTAIGTIASPLITATALTSAAATGGSTYGVARDYDAGVVRTWTVDLAREMGDAWNVSGGLTAARGSHLDIIRAPNRGPAGLRFTDVQPFLWQTSEGRSRLRSATVRVRRSYVRGWSAAANYTLASSMDNASTIGGGATVVAQDEQHLDAEWGRSSFDRRHQLSGDLNVELPFGPNHRWLNHGGLWAGMLESWSAYVTFAVSSGTPLTARVLSSTADAARGTNGTLRADATGLPAMVSSPDSTRFFNTAAFAIPAPGTFGSAPRNSIPGPANRDLSLQMTRDLPAGGTRTMSVQIRATNLLNLVNYAAVDTVVNSPTFGQVLSVRSMRSVQINARWKF